MRSRQLQACPRIDRATRPRQCGPAAAAVRRQARGPQTTRQSHPILPRLETSREHRKQDLWRKPAKERARRGGSARYLSLAAGRTRWHGCPAPPSRPRGTCLAGVVQDRIAGAQEPRYTVGFLAITISSPAHLELPVWSRPVRRALRPDTKGAGDPKTEQNRALRPDPKGASDPRKPGFSLFPLTGWRPCAPAIRTRTKLRKKTANLPTADRGSHTYLGNRPGIRGNLTPSYPTTSW